MASEVADLKKEESTILSNYDAVLIESFNSSREMFNHVVTSSNVWLENSSRTINKTAFLNINSQYLSTINDINKEYLAFNNLNKQIKLLNY